MKKTILSIILLFMSSVAFAHNWVPIESKLTTAKIYFDSSMISREGQIVRARIMFSLTPPYPIGNLFARSVDMIMIMKCTTPGTVLMEYAVFYDNPIPSGIIVSEIGRGAVMPFEVGSSNWDIQQAICRR